MKVKNFMTGRVIAATPKATCQELAKKMLVGNFSGLPIVNEKLHVVGVVSEFDILKALRQDRDNLLSSALAEEVMSADPICVDDDADLDEAIDLMTKNHIIRLPVVRENKLVGVISRCDILKAYVRDTFITLDAGNVAARE